MHKLLQAEYCRLPLPEQPVRELLHLLLLEHRNLHPEHVAVPLLIA